VPANVEAAVEAARRRALDERAFWQRQYPDYLKRYPGQFVVVKGSEFLAAVPDLKALEALLAKWGLSRPDVMVRYMREPLPLLL